MDFVRTLQTCVQLETDVARLCAETRDIEILKTCAVEGPQAVYTHDRDDRLDIF